MRIFIPPSKIEKVRKVSAGARAGRLDSFWTAYLSDLYEEVRLVSNGTRIPRPEMYYREAKDLSAQVLAARILMGNAVWMRRGDITPRLDLSEKRLEEIAGIPSHPPRRGYSTNALERACVDLNRELEAASL
jgi:hypothetical protein